MVWRVGRLTREGTAEPLSRDQIPSRKQEQRNIHFPCSADHDQDWQPYPVDLWSSIYDDCIYILPWGQTHSTTFFAEPVLRTLSSTLATGRHNNRSFLSWYLELPLSAAVSLMQPTEHMISPYMVAWPKRSIVNQEERSYSCSSFGHFSHARPAKFFGPWAVIFLPGGGHFGVALHT